MFQEGLSEKKKCLFNLVKTSWNLYFLQIFEKVISRANDIRETTRFDILQNVLFRTLGSSTKLALVVERIAARQYL